MAEVKAPEDVLVGTFPPRYEVLPHAFWMGPETDLTVKNGTQLAPDLSPIVSPQIIEDLSANFVVTIEEKMDGQRVGILIDDLGIIRVCTGTNQYINPNKKMWWLMDFWSWLKDYEKVIRSRLFPSRVLWGIWTQFFREVPYRDMPSWFFGIDVYDRDVGDYMTSSARDTLFDDMHITPAPNLAVMVPTPGEPLRKTIEEFLQTSGTYSDDVYGLVLRFEDDDKFGRTAFKVDHPIYFTTEPRYDARRILNTVGRSHELRLV